MVTYQCHICNKPTTTTPCRFCGHRCDACSSCRIEKTTTTATTTTTTALPRQSQFQTQTQSQRSQPPHQPPRRRGTGSSLSERDREPTGFRVREEDDKIHLSLLLNFPGLPMRMFRSKSGKDGNNGSAQGWKKPPTTATAGGSSSGRYRQGESRATNNDGISTTGRQYSSPYAAIRRSNTVGESCGGGNSSSYLRERSESTMGRAGVARAATSNDEDDQTYGTERTGTRIVNEALRREDEERQRRRRRHRRYPSPQRQQPQSGVARFLSRLSAKGRERAALEELEKYTSGTRWATSGPPAPRRRRRRRRRTTTATTTSSRGSASGSSSSCSSTERRIASVNERYARQESSGNQVGVGAGAGAEYHPKASKVSEVSESVYSNDHPSLHKFESLRQHGNRPQGNHWYEDSYFLEDAGGGGGSRDQESRRQRPQASSSRNTGRREDGMPGDSRMSSRQTQAQPQQQQQQRSETRQADSQSRRPGSSSRNSDYPRQSSAMNSRSSPASQQADFYTPASLRPRSQRSDQQRRTEENQQASAVGINTWISALQADKLSQL